MSGLDELLNCSRDELMMRWRSSYSSAPPKHTSTLLLQKVLAYDLQCKAEGDIPTRTRKVLRHALRTAHRSVKKDTGCGTSSIENAVVDRGQRVGSNVVLAPGVQLVREWNGRTWRVEVLEEGFLCKDKTYRSLSAIARMITGTRWSGPRFFGLNT